MTFMQAGVGHTGFIYRLSPSFAMSATQEVGSEDLHPVLH